MNRIRIDKQIPSVSSPSISNPKDNGFAHRLKRAVGEVNRLQFSANDAIEQVSKGSMDLHEGMLAINKADLSLKLLIQVRNKVMDAYREISRMSV